VNFLHLAMQKEVISWLVLLPWTIENMKHAFGGYSICNRWKEIGITILITNNWFRKTVS